MSFSTLPVYVWGWTVASHRPGYTLPSDTWRACVRNPSLLVDAASTGGTWSVSVWANHITPTWDCISHDTIYNCCHIRCAQFPWNHTCIRQRSTFPSVVWKQKQFIRSRMWTDCQLACWSSSREKLKALDKYQEYNQSNKASGYQATGKLRHRHRYLATPWYFAPSVCVAVSSASLLACSHFTFPPFITYNCDNQIFVCATITFEPCNYSNQG